MSLKMSNQMLGALMMALQQSLLAQEDIVPVLRSFEMEADKEGNLIVTNAPTVDLSKSAEMDFSGLEVEEMDEVQ